MRRGFPKTGRDKIFSMIWSLSGFGKLMIVKDQPFDSRNVIQLIVFGLDSQRATNRMMWHTGNNGCINLIIFWLFASDLEQPLARFDILPFL